MCLTLDTAYLDDKNTEVIQLKIKRLAEAYQNRLWKFALTFFELDILR